MTTQKTAQIRTKLKKLGITSRQVSVTTPHYGSIQVTIKDPKVALATVEPIAEAHKHIDRCHMSGEILMGGNTFVSVDYSDAAKVALAEPFLGAVVSAIEQAQAKPGSCIQVTEKTSISCDRDCFWNLTLWVNEDGDGGGTPRSFGTNPQDISVAVALAG